MNVSNCTTSSRRLCPKNFDYQPLQIRFDEHGDLLVTGNNALSKYRLSEDNSGVTLICSCEELTKAYGLCIMDIGIILVISQGDDGSVYVISEGGEI